MFASLLLASYIVTFVHSEINQIVGGSSVSASEHPYIAVILWNSGALHCGGSILRKESPAVILTAAHCVDGSFNPSNFFVRLYASDYDASHSESNNYIDVKIADHVMHEDYVDVGIGDDIALLFIQDDISNYGRLETVSIESLLPNVEPSAAGDSVQVVGYGHDSSGGVPTPTLEEVTIPYINRATCSSQYSEVNTEMICAGAVGYDSCQGDSGGPLLRKGTNQQIGIVSWGYGCATNPGIYTNLGVYYDWVWDTITSYNCGQFVVTELETNTNVAQGKKVRYSIETDDDTEKLTVNTDVTSGDADLYVRYGAFPYQSNYDCRPYSASGSESCEFYPAKVGTYHIMVRGYSSVVGLSVTAIAKKCSDATTTTSEPTTSEPTTAEPTTAEPTTADPTTAEPTTPPTTADPTTSEPTTAEPTTADPTTAEPTDNPLTAAPTAQPTTAEPTTTEPTRVPTAAPTAYSSLWITGKKVKFMARDCDLCINDRPGTNRLNLVDCDTAVSGNAIRWGLDFSSGDMRFRFSNEDSGKKLFAEWNNKGTNFFLKSKNVDGDFFDISYELEGGIYYIQMKHVESGACPQWDGCDDSSLQMVDCSLLAEPYNLQVIDL